MKVSLIGLGNILMRDEGVGVHAVKTVQEHYELTPEVDCVAGGPAGSDLLPILEDRERVLFVDAVHFGREPGFIGELIDEANPAAFGKSKTSLHHVGLADVLAAARLMGVLPKDVCLIGIQPQALEVGLDLSETLQGKLALLVAKIIANLQEWGIICTKRSWQDLHAIDKARERPELGVLVGHGFRRILVRRFPFSLIYAVEAGQIVVVAVAHLRRRPEFWKGRI